MKRALSPDDVTWWTCLGAIACLLMAALVLASTRDIHLTDPKQLVCAPYSTPAGQAWSCVQAEDVARWILGVKR